MSADGSLIRNWLSRKKSRCSRPCKRLPKEWSTNVSFAATRCKHTSQLRRHRTIQSCALVFSIRLWTLLMRLTIISRGLTLRRLIHETGTSGFNCSSTICLLRALWTNLPICSLKSLLVRDWRKKRPRSIHLISNWTSLS